MLVIYYYRQEAKWKQLGLVLSRTTMANWIIIAAKEYFIPIVNRMHEMMVQSHIHYDEILVYTLNESVKKNHTWEYTLVLKKVKDLLRYLKIA